MKKIRNIIIAIITVIVVGIAGFLGWFLATREGVIIENGYVVNIKAGADYTSRLITTYEEYQELTSTFNITPDKTEKDFETSDYILDFINYEKNLKVEKINADISLDGVNLTYNLSHEVEVGEQLILYLIPIEKNLIPNYTLANREFVYSK